MEMWEINGVDFENGKVMAIYVSHDYLDLDNTKFVPDRPHGEWKLDGTCSECGVYSSLNKDTTYFCPNCGSDNRPKEGEKNESCN